MARTPTPVAAPATANAPETPPVANTVDAGGSAPAPETPPVADETIDPAPEADPATLVEVRVLRAEGGHAIDDVVSLSLDEAAAAVGAGWADDSPAAVEYARSVGA